MSELINKQGVSNIFHRQLLASVSAFALTAYVASTGIARADGADRPTVWIELGGQLSRAENGLEAFAPAFVALTPSGFASPLIAEKPARYGFDESVALNFQPTGSDWIFSASVRYGRSGNSKHTRQQSSPADFTRYSKFHHSFYGVYQHFTNHYQVVPLGARFTDTVSKQNETHTLLDFQAGRDLGIGLFGHNSSSAVNVGVRFAQFTSKSLVKLRENPDWQFKTHISHYGFAYDSGGYHFSFYRTAQVAAQPFHSFAGNFQASRTFNGLGPSISWNSSEPLVGNSERGELSLDFGVNASLLFGRQKAKIHHQTTGHFHSSYATPANLPITYQRPAAPDHTRSRGIVVPNIGAFAGLSVRYPNVKVGFGYKADFFFGAMDGGIDVRRTEDVGFHGPFASVSIGLGG